MSTKKEKVIRIEPEHQKTESVKITPYQKARLAEMGHTTSHGVSLAVDAYINKQLNDDSKFSNIEREMMEIRSLLKAMERKLR